MEWRIAKIIFFCARGGRSRVDESDGPRESAEVDRVGISVLALCCAGVIMCFSAYVINQSTFLFTNSWAVVTRW